MLFDTWQYFLFLPLVVLLHFLLPFRVRWAWLLAASFFFYMCWRVDYAILLVISGLTDYLAGIFLESTSRPAVRRVLLGLSMTVNLGLLFSFKYFNFFSRSFTAASQHLGLGFSAPVLDVLLPVGISFYTFQTLAYTFDVYLGRIRAERHLGYYFLYVTFFPQLVAGPIERASNLLPQFFHEHRFDRARATWGMQWVLWGLFKKIVVADRLAEIVNIVYNNPGDFSGPGFVLATICFAFQIYCDFSGYSDIAIGSARIMGFELMENFRRPYLARDIREFWNRWHISLSQWFRDYVYFPMGGNRVAEARRAFNILTVFVVSGIWHGANWTFFIWGLLHGLYYLGFSFSEAPRDWLRKIPGLRGRPLRERALAMLLTFLAVNFAWIFFRANSLDDAVLIVTHLLSGWGDVASVAGLRENLLWKLNLGRENIAALFFAMTVLLAGDALSEKEHFWRRLMRRNLLVRWTIYTILALAVMNLGAAEEIPFVYFQF